jgi:uridine kinase
MPARAGAICRPSVDREFPSPSRTAVSTWRAVCRGLLSRQLRLRRAPPSAVSEPITAAPVDAVLIFEGVFLMRPELIDRWDLRIFVSATFEETVARVRSRDAALYRTPVDVERRFRSRYRPSQQFYFDTVRSTDHADILVRNDEPQRPTWEVRPH